MKVTEKLYNYFKKRYLKNSYDYERIFMQILIDTYKPNTIGLMGFFGVECEQFQ